MRITSYVRLPVNRPRVAVPHESASAPPPNTATADFELKCGPEKQDVFYECLQCRSAGLSVFSRDCVAVPNEILEEMSMHLEMCEGFR